MSRISTRSMYWAVMLSLCLGLGLAPTCLAQNEPLIAEISVEGNDYISAEAIIEEVSAILKIGSPLTAQARVAAVARIKKLAYFDEVTIGVKKAERGVAVIITVVEKKRVSKVLLVGNTVITDDQLREAIFIREGTPIGLRMMSTGVPSGKKGMSSLGAIRAMTPLLPCRPASLSPTETLRFWAIQTCTHSFTPAGRSSPFSWREYALTLITLPQSPWGTRREVSLTSRAFSPKMARSSFSSADSSVSPFGVILPTNSLYLGLKSLRRIMSLRVV